MLDTRYEFILTPGFYYFYEIRFTRYAIRVNVSVNFSGVARKREKIFITFVFLSSFFSSSFSLLDTRYDILDTDLGFAKAYHYGYNYKEFM